MATLVSTPLVVTSLLPTPLVGANPSIGWVEHGAILVGKELVEIEVKADTGAATSSLHATDIQPFEKNGRSMVRFRLAFGTKARELELPLVKVDDVRSSDGDEEQRFFVEVPLCLGKSRDRVLFSLNDRSKMRYHVLLGRRFLRDRYMVDSSRKYVLGKPACL